LGAITRALADAGVNIEAQYSDHDHDHRLILVADDPRTAAAVTVAWADPPRPPITRGGDVSGD
jgi:hypothetical protein